MATQDAINNSLFNKYNEVLKEQSATNGYLKAIVDQNNKLIELLKKALYALAGIASVCVTACLFALIYGAIGEKGLHSVRQTMPTMAAIPAHNDFDDGKWKRWEPSFS